MLAWGLLAGVPLAPSTNAVRACWEAIDEAWIQQQLTMPESPIPDGLDGTRLERKLHTSLAELTEADVVGCFQETLEGKTP